MQRIQFLKVIFKTAQSQFREFEIFLVRLFKIHEKIILFLGNETSSNSSNPIEINREIYGKSTKREENFSMSACVLKNLSISQIKLSLF